MKLQHSQSGVALITAILIVTLATIWVTSIVWLDHLQQRRVASLLLNDQATLYAFGAESWAHDILRLDLEDGPTDHLSEEWAIPLPPLPVEGGQIEGRMEDMQGRFNINNLITPNGQPDQAALEVFTRLLESLQIDPTIAGYVIDWVDPDVEVGFPEGAEDDVYTARTPPYRTGNGPVTTISELRAINGIDAEIFALLAPHVAALPIGTTININTATPEVLNALSDQISLFDAQSMADGRIDAPFDSLEEIRDDVSPQVLRQLSVSSDFFRATVLVTLGTMRLSMYSLLERDEAGQVGTRLRSFGTD
ncbi:MAG: type II secretion system minor pseudopilin GspK [Gammaproteobacteria bacterium]|nr:type II secretion system minor pseudopilin GspK [Gammaproteobacteria bacterium]